MKKGVLWFLGLLTIFFGVGVISIFTTMAALNEAESVDSPKMAENVEGEVVGVVLMAMT